MFAHRLKAHVTPNQPLILPLPAHLPAGEVEVIVLFPDQSAPNGTCSSLRDFAAWLRQQPPSQRGQEEMIRQVEAERVAWE